MDKNITIRTQLKSGDLGAIISLHGELYSKEYKYDYTFEAYVGKELSSFALRTNNKEKIWIVEYNNIIVGSIAICEYSNTEAQLRWFLISPVLRGKGIGKELIQKALSFSKLNNYTSIHLWTVKGLQKARKIYIDNNFELKEEISHNIWGSDHIEQKYFKFLY